MSVIGFTTDNGQTQIKYDYTMLDNLPDIPEVDTTLSQQGHAADAGATGHVKSTAFFSAEKLSDTLSGIITDVVPVLEVGDMTINSSGWTYNDGTTRAKQRVRTAKGYSISLKSGDKIGLTDYTDARYYLGWKLSDNTYGSHGWYTADTSIAYDGDYVILLAHNTEVDQSGVEALGNLLFIKKFGGYFNPVAVSQRASGKDILKTTTWEEGYINASGSIHVPTAQQEIATDFIAIDTSTAYRMRLKHSRYTESTENSPWLGIASYDSDRNFVRRPAVSTAVYKDDEYEYLEMLFTPQSGEASIRISFRSFGNYSAELIALTDGVTWYGYDVAEPKDFQNGHELALKGVNHRGWGECPENTLIAYKQSAVHGFKYVETDVRYTSDDVPVLLHDASINRTARNADGTSISGTVNISSITYSESQGYDFGVYKGSDFAGTKIPKFEDFIILCKRLGLHPYIELKTGMTNAQIINLVDIVRAYGMLDNVTWIAYATGWFNLITNRHSRSRIGVLMTTTSQANITSAKAYRTGDNSVFINTSDYDSEAIALAKANGIPMEVWTIDADEDIIALDPYITGVTSNLKNAGKVIYDNLPTIPEGVTAEIKLALLNCMQAVAWATEDGQELYDALYTALNPPENLTSITAVYTQSGTIYTTDNITILRNGLVVTANYSDGTSEQVYSYALTGTLTAGTSTITVQYAGKIATFTVTVTDGTLIYELASPATFTGNASETIDTNVVVEPTDRDITILLQFNPNSSIANGGFMFYTGMTSSPYSTIGIKSYTSSESSYHPFRVTANVESKGVTLSNVEYGEENLVALRYTQGDTGVEVFAYNATNGLITGKTTDKNIVAASATMKIGAASTSGTPYKGTISKFKVYSRALTDEEIYAFLDGEVA